ncbi:ABC transporter permease [Sodalis ligni]|uniref:ABC transporter permease n=1 Tax=Sodalis ligni TaxID=2697027 RepID=UPI0023DE9F63|nr:ABC transporter permease [Sodalis ligni]
MMDLPFIVDCLRRMLAGVPLTLQLAAISLLCGALLGLLIAFARLSGNRLVAAFGWIYVQVIRSTPLLVLLFLMYYGPGQFPAIRHSVLWPFLREPYYCALLALLINSSGYAAEIIRGGLLSVPHNEIEAARACGMSGVLLYRRIILPIAIRQALPAFSNEVIAMIKATSLVSLVTLMEITGIATDIASESYRPIPVFIAAGAIYLLINFILTRIIRAIEHGLTPHLRSPPVNIILKESPYDHN